MRFTKDWLDVHLKTKKNEQEIMRYILFLSFQKNVRPKNYISSCKFKNKMKKKMEFARPARFASRNGIFDTARYLEKEPG